jgi:rubrerythrin
MDQINGLSSPMEILEEALKRELAAYKFYAAVRDQVKMPIVRDLAETLCEEERRHARMIEKQISKLRLG